MAGSIPTSSDLAESIRDMMRDVYQTKIGDAMRRAPSILIYECNKNTSTDEIEHVLKIKHRDPLWQNGKIIWEKKSSGYYELIDDATIATVALILSSYGGEPEDG